MKKIKFITVGLLIVCSLLFISGCSNSQTSNEYIDLSQIVSAGGGEENKTVDVTVYYQDSNGYIVPVQTSIPWTEGIAKAVIRKMMNTSELQKELVIMGLESLMPPEAAINGMDISDGLAKIDFKTDKLTFDSAKSEQNFVQGVVLALTSLPTVNRVQFMFNGHIITSLPNGTKVESPISALDLNTVSQSTKGEAICVYYHATSPTNFEYYVPVTVYVENADCFSALEYLIGNTCSSLNSGIPEGTELVGIQTIGDTLCIFLNDSFNKLKDCSAAEEAAAIKSIALTCAAFDDSLRIKLYAGSHEYIPAEGIDTPSFANIY